MGELKASTATIEEMASKTCNVPLDINNFTEKPIVEGNITPDPSETPAGSVNSVEGELGVYQGQLLGLQLEAFIRWKETDDYKRAYLPKKKKTRTRPQWTPQSREYMASSSMDGIDWGLGTPWSVGSQEATVDKLTYKSLEYKSDRKKMRVPRQFETTQSAYKSLEYQRAYPVSLVSSPRSGSRSKDPSVEVVKSVADKSQMGSQAAEEDSADWV